MVHAELLKLSVEDDKDIYDMLQEFPKNENGLGLWYNSGHDDKIVQRESEGSSCPKNDECTMKTSKRML